MITRSTVFLLGAGASVDYGFPLGRDLINLVVSGLTDTGFLRKAMSSLGYNDTLLDEFGQKLAGSRLDSIDAFLEDNTDRYQQIGKAAIAGTILLKEKDAANKLAQGGIKGDWLRYVWNTMKASTTVGTFPENSVTFVTFNYDRLVEHYFAVVLMNAFNLTLNEAADLRDRTFRVVHLHGSVDGVPFGEFPTPLEGEFLGELASGIRVIHDDDVTTDSAFRSTYDALREAYRSCMLGFGYHPDNLRRLDLLGNLGSRELKGTGFEMGRAEVKMAKTHVDRGFTIGDPALKCGPFLKEHVTLE